MNKTFNSIMLKKKPKKKQEEQEELDQLHD